MKYAQSKINPIEQNWNQGDFSNITSVVLLILRVLLEINTLFFLSNPAIPLSKQFHTSIEITFIKRFFLKFILIKRKAFLDYKIS